jgi:hypothetical protein
MSLELSEDNLASVDIDHYNKTNEDSDDEANDDHKDSQDGEENEEEGKTFADKLADIAVGVINKFEIFRTRQGRAGLVHNFLRGLEMSSGEFTIYYFKQICVLRTSSIIIKMFFVYQMTALITQTTKSW